MNDLGKYLLSNLAALLLAVLAVSAPALAAWSSATLTPLAALAAQHWQAWLAPRHSSAGVDHHGGAAGQQGRQADQRG